MKKLFLFMLSIILIVGITGCGKQTANEPNVPATDAPTEATATPLAPSTNKTVVTEEEAPKVFWAMDIVYHLENCSELSGKEAQEVPWSMVKEIGLRQCPVCNLPQYDSYVESSDSE